jgi:protein gp37
MAQNTAIAWADHTANYWIGCMKVSPACDHCYAEAWAERAGGRYKDAWSGRRYRTSDIKWRENMKYRLMAPPGGGRPRIFVNSLSDTFDNQVPEDWRVAMFKDIKICVEGDYLLLTKRPQNILKMLPPDWGEGYPNVWIGATVENQTEAMRRIPQLLAVPAAKRFLSCEPLLGEVDLTKVWATLPSACTSEGMSLLNTLQPSDEGRRIDWVICGGESGSMYRDMNPAWARSLRDQCAAAGVPFFMKQMTGGSQRSMRPIPDDLMVRQVPEALP